MTSPKIAPTLSRRNSIIIFAVTLGLVIATAVVMWFGEQLKMYQKNWHAYTSQVQTVLQTAVTKERTGQTLVMLADELQAIEPPVQPRLFGLGLGAEAERKKQEQVSQDMNAFRANAQATAAFVEYQQKVADQLHPLALAAAANAAQSVALAQRWQQATDEISELSPPAALTAQHTTLCEQLQEVQKTIASLSEFYQTNDEVGFAARYEQLQGMMTNLRAQSAAMTAVASALDTERATLIVRIKQNL